MKERIDLCAGEHTFPPVEIRACYELWPLWLTRNMNQVCRSLAQISKFLCISYLIAAEYE